MFLFLISFTSYVKYGYSMVDLEVIGSQQKPITNVVSNKTVALMRYANTISEYSPKEKSQIVLCIYKPFSLHIAYLTSSHRNKHN